MITRSVSTKFLVLFVPAFLVVTVLALNVVARNHVAQAQAELSARLGSQLGRVSSLLNAQMLTSDKALGSRLVSMLMADRAAVCVDITIDGVIDKVLSQPRNLGCGVLAPEEVVSTPLSAVDNGTMTLGFVLDEIRAINAASHRTAFQIALGGLIAAALIAALAFRHSVGLPVARLVGIMERTRDGTYPRAEALSRDEIGALARSYNALVDRLETEASTARQALAELSNAYHSTPALLFTMNREGAICSTSAFWSEATGYAEHEVRGQKLTDLLAGDLSAANARSLTRALKNGASLRDMPLRFRTADDAVIDVLLSLVPDRRNGQQCSSHVCVMNDVTMLRLTEQNLRQLAITDQLTGLPNRRAMGDCEALLGLEHRRDNPLWAVLFIDLDNFKTANDSFGHAAGDQLLVTVAQRIREAVGKRGMAARLGGDEFAVVLPDISGIETAKTLSCSIIEAINAPIEVPGGTAYVGASIGITSDRLNNARPSDSLTLCDQAMYLAKAAGKNRYYVHDGSEAEAMKLRSRIIKALRIGRDEGWFSLHFQPIVDLSTGKPVSLEALLRINPPDGDPLPTDKIIALAEEIGEMAPLGLWIIDTALENFRDIALSSDNDTLSLSVNLSPIQLNEQFVRHVEQWLADAPHLRNRLILEITEGATMQRFDRARELLMRLRACGVKIALDDFGTGYASLSYVSRLPIDILKLDRSFVRHADADCGGDAERTRKALISSVLSLTRELDIPLVAEGIEDIETAQALAAHGVPLGQGYLFARPMAASSISAWLAAFSGRRGQSSTGRSSARNPVQQVETA